jgi:ElaB/YqjD/DUF883 family membrane-anchored ribosome-binding protein
MNANTMNMGPSSPMSGMGDRLEDDITRRADQAVDQTATRAHEAVDRFAPNVDRMAERAHQTIDTVAQRAQETARRFSDSTSQYTDQWSAYVRQRPLSSIGVALAVGYVFGRLMR